MTTATATLSTAKRNSNPEFSVLTASFKSSLKDLMQKVCTLPDDIMEEAQTLGLEITGNLMFIYNGVDGNPDKELIIDIALPVKQSMDYSGKHTIRQLPAFESFDAVYTGNMQDLGALGYEPMMQAMSEQRINITDVCREIYNVWEGPESVNNEIVLQIGVSI